MTNNTIAEETSLSEKIADAVAVDKHLFPPTGGHSRHRHFLPAFIHSHRNPDAMPAGVNDWDTPVESGQIPVVLVHGTWMNSYCTWADLAPVLAEAGHRVFATNYGKDRDSLVGKLRAVHASDGLLESQVQLAAFVNKVLEETGAEQVDLIGHSQGGAQAILYANLSSRKGAVDNSSGRRLPKVRNVIGICSSHKGTTLSGVASLGNWIEKRMSIRRYIKGLVGQCAVDQMVDSDFIIDSVADLGPAAGVKHTMICTRYDEIVTPYHGGFLEGPDPDSPYDHSETEVTNHCVQDHGNSRDFSDHLSVLYSPRTAQIVLEQLSDGSGTGSVPRPRPSARGMVLPFLGKVG